MPSLNKVILCGNLTRDPEVRYLPSGMAVADLGMAINENYKNKDGAMVESTCYVDITVWGRQAETTGEYMRKGSPVLIEGRLQYESWENQQGEKRSKLKVRAERVQFLSTSGGAGGAATGSEAAPTESNVSSPPASTPVASQPSAALEEDEDGLPF